MPNHWSNRDEAKQYYIKRKTPRRGVFRYLIGLLLQMPHLPYPCQLVF